MGCHGCFLGDGIKNPCIPYDGPASLRGGILFVGEAPGKDEDAQGRCFVGPTGRLLRSFVSSLKLGVPVGFTNAVRCFPGKSNVLECRDACKKYLVKDVEKYRPDRVVTFGATAAASVTGSYQRMMEIVGGWTHVAPGLGVSLGLWKGIVQFAIHPSFCLHNPSMKPYWARTTRDIITKPPKAKRFPPPGSIDVVGLTSLSEVDEFVHDLIEIGSVEDSPLVVALDTEYLPSKNRLMCLAMAFDNRTAYTIDEDVLALEEVGEALSRLFSNRCIQMSAHNWKFDAHAMANYWHIDDAVFVDACNPWYDTSSMRKIHNPEAESKLAVVSWQVGMGGHKNEMLDLMGRTRTEKAYEKAYEESPDIVLRYCGYDAVACLRAAHFYRHILRDEGFWEVWSSTMAALGPTLYLLEQSGVSIDLEALEALDKRLETQLSIKLHSVRTSRVVRRLTSAGVLDSDFNPRSVVHKKLLLFSEHGLGLKSTKKTAKGEASVDAEVLTHSSKKHSVLQDLVEYNAIAHRRSTYVQGYRKVIWEDGKIHPTYRQDVARTGRLSCQNPNVQNIPNRGREDDIAIRRMIVSPIPGHLIMEVDGAQIELRAAAEVSGDEEMLRCFCDGVDIHRRTASIMTGAKLSDVSKEDRQRAKAVNFGLIYDMSAEGLRDYAKGSYGVDLDSSEAEEWRNVFFRTYRGYRVWMIREQAKAKKTGCAWVYWLGKPYRRRWLFGIGSKSRGEAGHALRQTLNTAVQGLASEWTMRGLNLCREDLRKGALRGVYSLNFTIHDSIGAVVEEGKKKTAFLSIAKRMVSIPTARVPLSVECKVGYSLGEMKELGTYP